MELGQLVYTLTLNDAGFAGQVDEATGKVKSSSEQMGGSMDETAGKSNALGGAFSSMAGQFVVGQAVFTAGQKVFEMIKGAINDALTAAKDWQTQQAGMQAELKSTGDASGMTADELTRLAEGMQKTTPISREASLAGENMLLTFTNLHKDVFPGVTRAVADMATRMNAGAIPTQQQMSQTAMQVGKALNDPVMGLTKLQRVGVTFTEQQKEQVKAMVAAGNTAGAQALMVAELNKEFGGSAAANMNTYQGQLAALKNRFNDLVGEGVKKAQKALQKLGEFLFQHKALLAAVVGAVAGLAIAIGVGLVAALFAALGGFTALAVAAAPFILIGVAIGAVAYEIASNWKALITFLQPVIDFFNTNIMPVLRIVANFVAQQLKAAWDDIKKSLDQVMQVLQPYVPYLKDLAVVLGIILLAPLLAVIAAFAVMIGIVVAVVVIGARLIGWLAEAIAWLTRFENTIYRAIFGALAGAGNWLYSTGANIINGLINGIENGINGAIRAVQRAGQSIINAAKKVLQIFSPSKVFSDIGANVAIGLAGGITNSTDKAVAATQGMAGAVTSAGQMASVSNNSSDQSSSTTYNIARVELTTADAVNEFFSIGNRNIQLEASGISPLAGTAGV